MLNLHRERVVVVWLNPLVVIKKSVLCPKSGGAHSARLLYFIDPFVRLVTTDRSLHFNDKEQIFLRVLRERLKLAFIVFRNAVAGVSHFEKYI